MSTFKNSRVVIPAKAGIQSPHHGTAQTLQKVDVYTLKTEPKNECLRHCHTATIFEVAKAIWAKFK